MQRIIELSLARAEGAIVRTIGLIERRGYTVTAIETQRASSDDTLDLRLAVTSRGRPFDVLIRQIDRLFDVRSARLIELPRANAARLAC